MLSRKTKTHGEAGVYKHGHRAYVGGMWDEIGRLQLDFMRSQGLRPEHVLLDVACGSLRGGVHFIPYLDEGNYLGIEKEQSLIDAGFREELPSDVRDSKHPEVVVSDSFEFHRFSKQPDFVLAQSLFTHLPIPIIERCFERLSEVAKPSTLFYASFSESAKRRRNPAKPHDHIAWRYTRSEIEAFGHSSGWTARYIGDWNHPRGLVIAEYRIGRVASR